MTLQKWKKFYTIGEILLVILYTIIHTLYDSVIDVFWSEILTTQSIIHPVEIDTSLDDVNGWDYDAAGGKFPRPTKKDWVDFWEETYYPEEHKQYTEEEMDAMCERAATENDKDKCREYNLREAEYYTKRAELDASDRLNMQYDLYEEIKKAGGYEWTPNNWCTLLNFLLHLLLECVWRDLQQVREMYVSLTIINQVWYIMKQKNPAMLMAHSTLGVRSVSKAM